MAVYEASSEADIVNDGHRFHLGAEIVRQLSCSFGLIGLSGLVSLVHLVCLVYLVEPD